jgi:hypothetical protein
MVLKNRPLSAGLILNNAQIIYLNEMQEIQKNTKNVK